MQFLCKNFPLLTEKCYYYYHLVGLRHGPHIICLKIDPQPFFVSLWNPFPNNCLWVFIRIRVGWTQWQQWGPCALIGYSLFLGWLWQGQSRVFHKTKCSVENLDLCDYEREKVCSVNLFYPYMICILWIQSCNEGYRFHTWLDLNHVPIQLDIWPN